MLFKRHFIALISALRALCFVPAKKRSTKVILSKLCRNTLIVFLAALALISTLLVQPGNCQEAEDSQVFISGFNAYQQKDYATTIKKMNEVLKKYPDTPLRDMTLFWLARAHYKSGNQQEAARYMSQFTKEFPDNPLKGTVEEELLALAAQQERGEKVASVKAAEKQAEAQKAAAKKQADLERQAALQKEQQRLAAVKAEEARQAAEKAAQLKRQAELAEQQKLAAAKAEEERVKAAKAEEVRLIAVKAEQEKAAAETVRQAAAKAEQEKAAEVARQAAVQQEQLRLAAAKAEQEKLAAAQAAQLKLAEEQKKQAEMQRLAEQEKAAEASRKAAIQKEQMRLAAAKAEQERLAAEQAAQLKLAEEQKKQAELKKQAEQERERLALAKQEEERLAQETAKKQRQAEVDAELARLAAVKAAEERVRAEKAEQARIAAAAEAVRKAELKKEQDRLAAAKLEADKVAREKAAQLKRAAELAEQQRQAALKAEQERLKAARVESDRLASEKAQAQQRQNEEAARLERVRFKEQAIAQYKSVVEKYPNSKAASVAVAKLKDLGVVVPVAAQPAVEPQENTQVLKVEVAQFGSFDFTMQPAQKTYDVAQRISLPFEVTNRGNGSDSFYLESGFPADYNSGFAAQAAPDKAINQTPSLSPGETFKGLVTLTIPASAIDGLRVMHPVKVASRFMGEATQSREISLVAASPLLRSVVKSDRLELLPGEKISYRIAALNVGSTTAKNVSIRLNFPPQLEPVDHAAAGFKQEMKAALVLDGVEIKSGESREYTVTFQLKDDSLAGQELIARAELINNPLNTSATFVSNVARVKPQHGIKVGAGPGRLVVIPGQSITVPFVVTNTGNVRDSFKLSPSFKGAAEITVFLDKNRDGIRQPTEPVITSIGPLEPKEEIGVAIEVKTSRNAADGAEGAIQMSLTSEGNSTLAGTGSTSLVYSRPVLQMSVAGRDSRLKPGEIATFELNVVNRGSNLARTVELLSSWPEQLELVASEPLNGSSSSKGYQWKFNELGAGEKRTIRVSFRVKPGIGVGTSVQVKNIMTYEDQLGNRY